MSASVNLACGSFLAFTRCLLVRLPVLAVAVAVAVALVLPLVLIGTSAVVASVVTTTATATATATAATIGMRPYCTLVRRLRPGVAFVRYQGPTATVSAASGMTRSTGSTGGNGGTPIASLSMIAMTSTTASISIHSNTRMHHHRPQQYGYQHHSRSWTMSSLSGSKGHDRCSHRLRHDSPALLAAHSPHLPHLPNLSGTAASATTTTVLWRGASTSNTAWQVGDAVQVCRNNDTLPMDGRIREINRGWYTVDIVLAGENQVVKCRAKDLVLIPDGAATNATMTRPTAAAAATSSSTTPGYDSINPLDQSSSVAIQTTPIIGAAPATKEIPTTLASVFPHVTTNRDAPELPMEVPPPPTIINWDEVLVSHHNALSSLDDPSLQWQATKTVTTTREQLQQVSYFSSFTQWVVFTDLHCSSSTLETCQQVLALVHQHAVDRNAGILFLGDFWHVRGSLRVDLLNAILLDSLAHWTQPMIMIPGNHDQVTASMSENHSLTPLLHAYRVVVPPPSIPAAPTDGDTTPATLPGVLIFSHATAFNQALWVPHIRSPAVLESILQSPLVQNASLTQAIFCHVDLTGGYMNDNIVSNGGVPPRVFPPNIPVYTGHFHKPHVISRTTYNDETGAKEVRCIEYLGSPYQVSLAEAHQSKALAVLAYSRNSTSPESSAWTCIDRLPLRLGRRHFRPSNLTDFLSLVVVGDFNLESTYATDFDTTCVRAGDRVVLSMGRDELATIRRSPTRIEENDAEKPILNTLDEHVTFLRKAGVLVEIREKVADWSSASNSTATPQDDGTPHLVGMNEDMSPPTMWRTFLDKQCERGSLSESAKANLLPAGLEVLEEIESGGSASVVTPSGDVNGSEGAAPGIANRAFSTPFTDPSRKSVSGGFQLNSLSLQGFGPFRDAITYPLSDRGLVLLRGTNRDGGTDSNGTGKTSLAMSILWALTGSIDPRPFQDAKVSDVINDASKAAVVTIRGTLHGIPFSISRTKTSSKSGLTFLYDSVDLTTQSPKETQELIYERLGISPDVLSRTMFHGQHSLNELLEATDSKLKEELSLVVNLSVWQNAASVTRKKARVVTKQISEYDGMLTIRSSDIADLQKRLDEAQTEASRMEETYQTAKLCSQKEVGFLATALDEPQSSQSSLDDLGKKASLGDNAICALATERHELTLSQAVALSALEAELESVNSNLTTRETEFRNAGHAHQVSIIGFNVAQDRIANFQRMWKLDFDPSVDDFDFLLPENCPMCRQSISSTTGDHNHESISDGVQNDFSSLRTKLKEAGSDLNRCDEAVRVANASRQEALDRVSDVQRRLAESNQIWQQQLDEVDSTLQDARSTQQYLVAQVTLRAKRLEAESKRHALLADLAVDKEKYESANRVVERIHAELKECEKRVANIASEKMAQTQILQVMTELTDVFGPRGIQTFVLQGAVANLEDLASGMLTELSEGTQQLKLSLDTGDRIARRAFVRSDSLRDGGAFKERPLGSLSGGQWRRCSLALTLAFAELVASRTQFNPSLIVLDEPLTHLDQTGRASVGRVLRNSIRRTSEHQHLRGDEAPFEQSSALKVSTILLILQDLAAVEMEECFDCIDDVVKSNGLSDVQVDSGFHGSHEQLFPRI